MKHGVYALSNKSNPGVLKIGYTDKEMNKRLSSINSTGVLHDWQVEIFFSCNNPRGLERSLHSVFAAQRVRKDREFFTVSVQQVKHEIKNSPFSSQKEIKFNKPKTYTSRYVKGSAVAQSQAQVAAWVQKRKEAPADRAEEQRCESPAGVAEENSRVAKNKRDNVINNAIVVGAAAGLAPVTGGLSLLLLSGINMWKNK